MLHRDYNQVVDDIIENDGRERRHAREEDFIGTFRSGNGERRRERSVRFLRDTQPLPVTQSTSSRADTYVPTDRSEKSTPNGNNNQNAKAKRVSTTYDDERLVSDDEEERENYVLKKLMSYRGTTTDTRRVGCETQDSDIRGTEMDEWVWTGTDRMKANHQDRKTDDVGQEHGRDGKQGEEEIELGGNNTTRTGTRDSNSNHAVYDDVDLEVDNRRGTTALEARRRPRGRPRKNSSAPVRSWPKTSGTHYDERDALGLAKAWIVVSSRRIQSEDTMWSQIAEICTSRYGMQRSKDSLRCKWATLQRDAYMWITCRARVEQEAGTGNWSREKYIKMTQACYAAQKAANAKNVKDQSPGAFKYIEAAEYLSRYPKFMDIESTTPGQTYFMEPHRRTTDTGCGNVGATRRTSGEFVRNMGRGMTNVTEGQRSERRRTVSARMRSLPARRICFEEEDEDDTPQSATGTNELFDERETGIIDLVEDDKDRVKTNEREGRNENCLTRDVDNVKSVGGIASRLLHERCNMTRRTDVSDEISEGRAVNTPRAQIRRSIDYDGRTVNPSGDTPSCSRQMPDGQAWTPSNSTPSDGTPSGGRERRGRTRGYGVRQQREAMIQNVKDERTESAVDKIRTDMKNANAEVIDIMKEQSDRGHAEEAYMYVQSLHLALQHIKEDGPTRDAIVEELVRTMAEEMERKRKDRQNRSDHGDVRGEVMESDKRVYDIRQARSSRQLDIGKEDVTDAPKRAVQRPTVPEEGGQARRGTCGSTKDDVKQGHDHYISCKQKTVVEAEDVREGEDYPDGYTSTIKPTSVDEWERMRTTRANRNMRKPVNTKEVHDVDALEEDDEITIVEVRVVKKDGKTRHVDEDGNRRHVKEEAHVAGLQGMSMDKTFVFGKGEETNVYAITKPNEETDREGKDVRESEGKEKGADMSDDAVTGVRHKRSVNVEARSDGREEKRLKNDEGGVHERRGEHRGDVCGTMKVVKDGRDVVDEEIHEGSSGYGEGKKRKEVEGDDRDVVHEELREGMQDTLLGCVDARVEGERGECGMRTHVDKSERMCGHGSHGDEEKNTRRRRVHEPGSYCIPPMRSVAERTFAMRTDGTAVHDIPQNDERHDVDDARK